MMLIWMMSTLEHRCGNFFEALLQGLESSRCLALRDVVVVGWSIGGGVRDLSVKTEPAKATPW
jgi:hypothetical protein